MDFNAFATFLCRGEGKSIYLLGLWEKHRRQEVECVGGSLSRVVMNGKCERDAESIRHGT